MTRVDFAFNAAARVEQAARSSLRHVARATRLFVYCDDSERLNQFDQALWSIDDTSFVPHDMIQEHQTEDLAVYLVDQAKWPLLVSRVQADDWLINLDDDCPPEVGLFSRVLEIVTQEDQDKAQARQRWRLYQSMGLELHAHQLGG